MFERYRAITALLLGLVPGLSAAQPRVILPVMPHEAAPEARPYPDYVAEALKRTRLVVDEPFRSVRPRGPAASDGLRYLVLPVQAQAFGFASAFSAVVAAHLDRELALRRVAANRQIDVLDAQGPFARRLGDGTVEALARQHPAAELLALYLGHDGIDRGFLTLTLKKDGRARSVHRELPLGADARPTAAAFAALLPKLLDELGLGASGGAAALPASPGSCTDEAWRMVRPAGTAGGIEWACHALVVGTLLPEFGGDDGYHPRAVTPAKLAWLATAYAEAQGGKASEPLAAAISELAWQQLHVPPGAGTQASAGPVRSADPVVSRVAKLLAAPMLFSRQPVRSGRDAIDQYLVQAAQGLPAFAAAAFIERGQLPGAFRTVDLCALERTLPGVMVSARCREEASAQGERTVPPGAGPGTAANESERLLFQEWRLAKYHKDIRYYGITLGQAAKLAQTLAALPNDVVRHPLIRQQAYIAYQRGSQEGSFAHQLERARAAVAAFVQSTADLQRFDGTLAGYSVSGHAWTGNALIESDAGVRQHVDDERRLLSVLRFDRYQSSELPPARRERGDGAAFLYEGPAYQADGELAQQAWQREAAARAASPAAVPATPVPAMRPLFMPLRDVEYTTIEEAALRSSIGSAPSNMNVRVALAMQLLRRGQPLTEARQLIDGRPRDQRLDRQIGESHVWSQPADAFFFSGELALARHYYDQVRTIGTGSSSDLTARTRIALIDGDFDAALDAAAARQRRYGSDYARRDLAGLLFMQGRQAEAWQVLKPRLVSPETVQLWMGALVGWRVEGMDLPGVMRWFEREGLEQAQLQQVRVSEILLHVHAVTDRLPTEAQAVSLAADYPPGVISSTAVSARLTRLALQKERIDADAFAALRTQMQQLDPSGINFMRPLFTWVAWQASAGRDPELDAVRATLPATGGFDALLSQALLRALEGQVQPSLDSLRAARVQMYELGAGSRNVERSVPSAYHYALAAYLMARKTGHEAYRAEALQFAQAYQRMFPYWGWAYALEALLSSDDKARRKALCRARYLDRASYFLSQLPAATAAQAAKGCAAAPKLWWR